MTVGRILVVDDSPTVRRVVTHGLKRAGLDVVAAKDGADAVARAATESFDLLVMDLVMPGIGGLQVLGRIAERLERTMPTILMCTRTDPLPRAGLDEIGVIDTITKPFSPEAIIAVVEHALDRLKRDHLAGLDDDDDATVPMRPAAFVARGAEEGASAADLSHALAGALYARGVVDADQLARRLSAAIADDPELSDALIGAFGEHQRSLPVLHGDLEAVALPEVLQLLKLQGQTGVLEVVLREARYEALFREGRIIAVRARDPRAEQRLGRYFVRQGALTAEELQTYLREPDPRDAIGQRLIRDERIHEDQLYEALRAQAVDLLYEMLRAHSGFFAMRRDDEGMPRVPGAGLSVDSVLFEALRQVDEWRVIEREVPSFDASFQISGEMRVDGLAPEEERVLKLVHGGHKSVSAIVEESDLKAFQASKILYRLVILQRVERDA